jgi:hypothetical protein
MAFIMPLILIGGGLFAIFYLRPKTQNSVTEMKFMKTKTITELKEMFSQMDANGLGNDYREFVELKGSIVSENLVETPFSNRKVPYCESKLIQVTETKEQYRDSNGAMRTRVSKHENTISDEKTSQEIYLSDNSSNETVILEINGVGCNLDIQKSFDRFEPKSNLNNYRYFNSFSWNRYGAETLGFKMVEKTIEINQSLYVIGEAFRVGDKIHIGKPQDSKKPFIVTTKSEEDMINKSNQNAKTYLIGGIVAIVIGVFMFISKM